MFLMFGGLTQVGPRFCMNPIKIFSGSFGGQTLYENPFYVSPNTVSSLFYCSLPYPPEDLEDQTKVIVLNCIIGFLLHHFRLYWAPGLTRHLQKMYVTDTRHCQTCTQDWGSFQLMLLLRIAEIRHQCPLDCKTWKLRTTTHTQEIDWIWQERSRDKRKKAGKYAKKVKAKQRRKAHLDINQTEPSELANVWDEE